MNEDIGTRAERELSSDERGLNESEGEREQSWAWPASLASQLSQLQGQGQGQGPALDILIMQYQSNECG